MSLTFFVRGTPAPQGSKRAFVVAGKARLVEMSKRVKPWRDLIVLEAREAMRRARAETITGPAAVTLEFVMPRPKGKPRRPGCDSPPDVDKLCRGVFDALTIAGVLEDDARVVRLTAWKRYARESGIEAPGCLVSVEQVATGS